ncbi:MAG: glycosyltransferase family 4 protein [Conexivisphaerales archaeon]
MFTSPLSSSLYGSERASLSLAKGLCDKGVEVKLLVKSSTKIKVNYPRLSVIKVYSPNLQLLRFTIRTIVETIRSKPDAMYLFNLDFEDSLVPGFIAAAFTGRKLIVSVLDNWMRQYDTKTITKLVSERVIARKGIRSTIRFMLFHFLRRLACKTTPACVTPSRTVGEYAKTILKAPRVYVIGRNIEDFWFFPSQRTPTFDAIYVGRIHKSKGVETILYSWKIVLETKPDALLLIVGSYENEKFKSYIEDLVDSLGLAGNVTFTGYIENQERIRDLLCSSKLFIFASKREGFANAVLQAMAAGLPCVLSDIPVLRQLYGEAAFLVPPDEPKKFADAILELLNDPKKRNLFRLKSIKLAEKMRKLDASRSLLFAVNKAFFFDSSMFDQKGPTVSTKDHTERTGP